MIERILEAGVRAGAITVCWAVKGPHGSITYRFTYRDGCDNAYDLGVHSKSPQSEWDKKMQGGPCRWTDGDCYYDGGSLAAEEMLPDVLTCGDDWLWARLEEKYRKTFGDEIEKVKQ